MRLVVVVLCMVLVVVHASHFHVRIREGDVGALDIQDEHDGVAQMATSEDGRVRMYEAPSEDALRYRLLRAGLQSRRSDRQVIIAEVQSVQLAPVVPEAASGSWGQDRIDQRTLPLNGDYSPIGTGAGVTAWVVDTGVDASHEDFGGRASNDFAAYSPAEDCDGHGTHVASTLGGEVYGVARGVRIRAIKVLDCQGTGSTFTVAQGLEYVLARLTGRDVINLSLGFGRRDLVIESIVEDLLAASAAVVASAGNEDENACSHFPSAYAGVVAVGASTRSDSRASYSNYGSCVDIFAPGSGIRAANLGGGSRELSGTSMASPHVAGAIAIRSSASSVLSTATQGVVSGANGTPNRLVYVGANAPQPTTTTSSSSSSSSSTSGMTPGNGSALLSISIALLVALVMLLV